MRVTILTQYYAPEVGAVQVRLGAFAKILKQLGHDVQVITAMPNYPDAVIHPAYRSKFIQKETIDGIDLTRTWIYPATGKNIIKRLANYFSFTLSSLFALFSVPKSDILFVESPPLFLGMSAVLAAKVRKQHLFVNISDLWPDSVVDLGIMSENRLIQFARGFERWLYSHAWRVGAVTEGIAERLERVKGVGKEKIVFLPNGVDTQMFTPQQPDAAFVQELGLQGKKIFAYTGLHGYAQGLDIILEVAKQLKTRDDIAFLFVGDGPEKPRLKALSQELGLANVHFLDAQPITKMSRIFAICTASIVPLKNIELFLGARPSKMFPPLGCAKPILYSGAGEAARLIEQAGCGIVTEPENGMLLAEAVLQLADQPKLATEMGLRGRAFVEQEYAWLTIVQRWLAQVSMVESYENRNSDRRTAPVH